MKIMATIEEAAETIVANQIPILCLDTCDFLDVVRGVAEGNLYHVESFSLLRDKLPAGSTRVQLLISYLVLCHS